MYKKLVIPYQPSKKVYEIIKRTYIYNAHSFSVAGTPSSIHSSIQPTSCSFKNLCTANLSRFLHTQKLYIVVLHSLAVAERMMIMLKFSTIFFFSVKNVSTVCGCISSCKWQAHNSLVHLLQTGNSFRRNFTITISLLLSHLLVGESPRSSLLPLFESDFSKLHIIVSHIRKSVHTTRLDDRSRFLCA